jgi:hypothetical protein
MMPALDLTPSMIGAMTNILKVQVSPMGTGSHVEPRTRAALLKRGMVQEVDHGLSSTIELTTEGVDALRTVGAQCADLVLQDALRTFDAEVSARALLTALQQVAPKSISQLDGSAYWPSWLKLTTSSSAAWHTSRSASDKVRKIRAELHLAAVALPMAIKQREAELEEAKVFAAEIEAVRALLEAPQA